MKATSLMNERHAIGDDRFVQLVVWGLPQPLAGSAHAFKYRLAFVVNGECVLRYDNEAGKGDHKHVQGVEHPYTFVSVDRLIDDFRLDVETWG